MAGIRSFVHVLGVSALILSSPTFAQSELAERGVFRTLGDAVASGLFEGVPSVEPGIDLGGGNPVDACVMDASCVQPNDNITGFNAAAFSTAETVTIGEMGTLNRFCAQFIFAPGGTCPPSTTDTALTLGWTLDFFDVLPDGDVDESSLITFDTDVLANMAVSVSAGGVFGGAFQITSVSMDLTAGGGMPVTAGQTIAINPQWTGFGGGCTNFFWASSSNVGDGSPTGDGFVLFDQSGNDDWSACEYVDNDLMVCLDIAAGTPVTTPDFSTPPSNDECDSPTPIACDTTFEQCLRFATANTTTDPAFACQSTAGLDDSFTGLHTVWYSVTPTSGRVRIDTCNLDGDPNFMLQVFRVADTPGTGTGPCDLVLLRCSDNDCEMGANVCLNDVVPGEELIVQVAAATSFDVVDLFLTVTCDEQDLPEAPANDECMNATQLFASAMPEPFETATHFGSTVCATVDEFNALSISGCGGATNGISPGVWFTAVGDGTVWSIDTYTAAPTGSFDTQLTIYCGNCPDALTCLAGNDDGAVGAPQSTIGSFCTEKGRRYYIQLHGFFDVGEYGLHVETDVDFAGGCTNSPTHEARCLECDLDCEAVLGGPADINEATDADALMEVCGVDVNFGCVSFSSPFFIEAGAPPFTSCGTSFLALASRDLDAYRFTLDTRSLVTFRMLAEFNPAYFLYDSDDCETNKVILSASGVVETELVTSTVLLPGTYVLTTTKDSFAGLPCGGCNDYVLQVDATPVCLGDCDQSSAVDFGDLVAMLFEFGTPGSSSDCDADGSGAVNFADLVAALFLFGPCP